MIQYSTNFMDVLAALLHSGWITEHMLTFDIHGNNTVEFSFITNRGRKMKIWFDVGEIELILSGNEVKLCNLVEEKINTAFRLIHRLKNVQ